MIALFLGAYHRLKISRRVALVIAGFALAILFNLGRTVLLVSVASRQGMQAISQWHDPAGVTILVGCFLGVWSLSALFLRGSRTFETGGIAGLNGPDMELQKAPALTLALGLFFWLTICEAGVELWYRSHEQNLQAKPSWVATLPQDAADFRDLPFPPQTVQLLRFDEGRNAVWTDRDGVHCQAIFLRWDPGRIAVHLARTHTPEVCLTSAGRKLTGETRSRTVAVDGLKLTFDVYHAAGEGLWVYYCLWEDQLGEDSSATERLSYRSRLQNVSDGRRNLGQRSLEFAVWSDAAEHEVFSRAEEQLKALIRTVDR
jgi:exosortase/archaeosortase family protein